MSDRYVFDRDPVITEAERDRAELEWAIEQPVLRPTHMGPEADQERERRLRRALTELLWECYGVQTAHDAAGEIVERLKRCL